MCNMDCAHCTRPVSKCRGGDDSKSATPWKGATRAEDEPKMRGKLIPAAHRTGRKRG